MGVWPSGSVSGIPSRRIRMLRAPNCDRAPKPRTEMRVSMRRIRSVRDRDAGQQ